MRHSLYSTDDTAEHHRSDVRHSTVTTCVNIGLTALTVTSQRDIILTAVFEAIMLQPVHSLSNDSGDIKKTITSAKHNFWHAMPGGLKGTVVTTSILTRLYNEAKHMP